MLNHHYSYKCNNTLVVVLGGDPEKVLEFGFATWVICCLEVRRVEITDDGDRW